VDGRGLLSVNHQSQDGAYLQPGQTIYMNSRTEEPVVSGGVYSFNPQGTFVRVPGDAGPDNVTLSK